jgi:GNAT superfamily N-acetyltransferase
MIIRWAVREDADGIAGVHISTWQSSYVGLVPQDYLNSLSPQKSAERWKGYLQKMGADSFCFVAVDELVGIVGFVSGGPNRIREYQYDGEIYAIYILKEYQRQGIGKGLFREGANWLLNQNCGSLIVWVLKENPAVNFYAALSGKPFHLKTVEIAGAKIVGISYVWDHIEDIATP